jgi:hypothetical protein
LSVFNRRRDENEPAVVAALEALGAVVCKLNDFGVPDLLVGYRGRTILVEVKNPDIDASRHTARSRPGKIAKGTAGPAENAKGQLTSKQVEWWSAWTGGEAYLVETPEAAVAAVRGEAMPRTLILGTIETSDGVFVRFTTTEDFAGELLIVPTNLRPAQADAFAGALHSLAGEARALTAVRS